jgi:Squalene-hopene cyclase C-terminal domain
MAVCASGQATPEQRATGYLSREVPRWYAENKCYSCHNNGDAARALYFAVRQGRSISRGALDGTSEWLAAPERWDHNRGNPAFSDKKLARIQFAAALAEATKAHVMKKRAPLIVAAAAVAREQSRDGSWIVDADADVGSPATWGTALATYMARGVLEAAGAKSFAGPVAKANAWFAAYQPSGVFESAVKLMAVPGATGLAGKIVAAQASDGGWGPRMHSPSEPFDTAIVVLALSRAGEGAEAVVRGRAYLIANQEKDGGWAETTRPPGGHSYAQHISTSGWATQALLATVR